MYKVNNKEQHWANSAVFINNFEHISNFFLLFFLADFKQVNVSWVILSQLNIERSRSQVFR